MSYWQDRMAKSQTKISEKSVKQIEKQMVKYYGAALKRTIGNFENVYNKVLLQAAEGKQITPALLYQMDSYWHLQAQLKEELEKLGNRQIALLSKQFEANFFEIYYSIEIEGAKAFSTLDTATAKQLINEIWVADNKSWSQRIWTNTEKLAETLNEELINIVATGDKSTVLKNKLQERFGASYSQADSLVKTEIAHIQTQAAKKRYEDYGISEVQVWADEDERRCDVCGELHEKKYPVGAAIPIPAHPRCRCCIIPVVE
jgi:SPP1 gp7 family putative phage head morphogenesis protein